MSREPALTPGITGIRRYVSNALVFELPPVEGVPAKARPLDTTPHEPDHFLCWNKRNALRVVREKRERLLETHIEVREAEIVKKLRAATAAPGAVSEFARQLKTGVSTVSAQRSGRVVITPKIAAHFGYSVLKLIRATSNDPFKYSYWKPLDAEALKQADEAHGNEPGIVAAKAVRDGARRLDVVAQGDEAQSAEASDEQVSGAIGV